MTRMARLHGQSPTGEAESTTKALTPEDTERAVQFLQNFAEDRGLVLPGRVPGFRRTDVKILPSLQSKALIWEHYRKLSAARGNN